jgi:hypothetical protein
MNERPGYFITFDLAIYLHPEYQNRRLGTYLLGEAVRPRVARLGDIERDLVMTGRRLV